MFRYRLYNGSLFLYEGACDEKRFEIIKNKYSFGQYKLVVLK